MRSCVPTLILLALLSALPEGPHLVDAVPAVPSGARIEPVSRWSKAAVLAWDYAPRVVTWEVLKNCSTDPFLLTTIRVAEPTLVDDRVASHERCTYRVQACDLDGCSQPAAAVHAVFGSVPGPPAGVIAVRPSLPNTLTARYLPPADSGAGDAATVALTNFRVEVSRDPSFSRVDAATESGDGAVWVQSLRVLKGSRYRPGP
ncbi:hypothetical protein T484DRAFT_1808764 [Baffinella frigidus]|nr:hypothetical protein T484DRAFT_1808764 [Cryptophyta sp. CCMP2293]